MKLTDFYEKNVAVLGFGISSRALIEPLFESLARVTIFDKKSIDQLKNASANIDNFRAELIFGANSFDELKSGRFDYIFRSPGIRPDIPEILAAQKMGAILTSETELFFELCPASIIGVTGSDGKTTTTTLIHKIFEKLGESARIGGNIGRPLIGEVGEILASDKVTLELSSFQLFTMKKSPHVAVITNLSQNHLDWHTSFDEYAASKANIFLSQSPHDSLIANFDCETSRGLAERAPSNVLYFSLKNSLERGAFLRGNKICLNLGGVARDILDAREIKIPGPHNVANFMAAILACFASLEPRTSADFEKIIAAVNSVAREFGGVPHRLEFVAELNGVKYFNSSIDTSPARTIAALGVFDCPLVLICGGKSKGVPYDEAFAAAVFDKTRAVILTGETADMIEKSLTDYAAKFGDRPKLEIFRRENYNEVVSLAKKIARPGDAVLLSPASTSFDRFKNFEERGELFRRLVLEK